VIVMQHGKIVESGAADDVLLRPAHPYTRALIDAIPRLTRPIEAEAETREPIMIVEGVNKTFSTGSGMFFGKRRVVHAVQDVSFKLHAGETIGIVGESGSGKSTLARCLVRLIDPDSGRVMIDGADIAHMSGSELRDQRRKLQMIFQDPFSSLNPRARVSRILTEGLIAFGAPKADALAKARELLEMVGLDASALGRFPHEFSGGQRQRIGIARALALNPSIIIADEAVSALDVSIQAQVLDLLADLKTRLNLSMLFITHDLRVAARVCDRIIVMRKGCVVEAGPTGKVLHDPSTAYTRSLLDAIPGQEYERALASAG
jgi:peptide/nickel transport system ATP-binding protein